MCFNTEKRDFQKFTKYWPFGLSLVHQQLWFCKSCTITGVSPLGKPNFRSVISNPWVPVQGFEVWERNSYSHLHGVSPQVMEVDGFSPMFVFPAFKRVTWDKVPGMLVFLGVDIYIYNDSWSNACRKTIDCQIGSLKPNDWGKHKISPKWRPRFTKISNCSCGKVESAYTMKFQKYPPVGNEHIPPW